MIGTLIFANPPRRRGRRHARPLVRRRKPTVKRRKLSLWQRMVKKFGGVKQAVAARRRGKKISRRSRGVPAATVTVSRRHRMARATRRRRGGRRSRRGFRLFRANPRRRVSRRRRSRRSRNPSGYVAIPRLLRRRRRSGRFAKTGRIVRRNPRRRRARRNSWWKEPIRHGRASRKGWSRRRRARRNPPRSRRYSRRRYRSNPGGRRRLRLLSNPIDSIMGLFKDAFSGDTLSNVAGLGVGFGGALAIAKIVNSDKFLKLTGQDTLDKAGRVGVTAGAAIAETFLLTLIGQRSLASSALVGGMLASLWQGLTEVLPAEAKQYIPTLGDAETDKFRKAIEQEVLRELNGGMGAYMTPAGAMSAYLPPAGASGYLTTGDIRSAGMGAYLTQREASRYGMGRADMEFDNNQMTEKF